MTELRYQHVEAALAEIFRVTDAGRMAFRARLRHLRNLGLPELPKVGQGTQLTYRTSHLHQLFFALELEEFGVDPIKAVAFVKKYFGILADAAGKQRDGSDRFIAFEPWFLSDSRCAEQEIRPRLCTEKQLLALLAKIGGRQSGFDDARLAVINVSKRIEFLTTVLRNRFEL
jgi:hypothetical protein